MTDTISTMKTVSSVTAASLSDLGTLFDRVNREYGAACAEADRLDSLMREELGRRPVGRSQSQAWDATAKQVAKRLGLDAAEDLASRLSAEHAALMRLICATPARNLADLAVKARLVACWAEPDPAVSALVADVLALQAAA